MHKTGIFRASLARVPPLYLATRGYSEPGTRGCPGPRHTGERPGPHPPFLCSIKHFYTAGGVRIQNKSSLPGFLVLPSSSPSPAHSGMLKGLELQRFRPFILSSKGFSPCIGCQLKFRKDCESFINIYSCGLCRLPSTCYEQFV